jgi:dTMP kinase
MFIVFEGIDGAGSNTQTDLLVKNLSKRVHNVTSTEEPTSQSIGRYIRLILQHKEKVSAKALQLLFTADRADHVENLINPEIQKNNFIVSARYFYSTIAFGSLKFNPEWLYQINSTFPKPDLCFYLDLPAEEAIKRISARGNDIELFEKKETLEKVRQNYLSITDKYDIIKLDATKSPEEISNEVLNFVLKHYDTNS